MMYAGTSIRGAKKVQNWGKGCVLVIVTNNILERT